MRRFLAALALLVFALTPALRGQAVPVPLTEAEIESGLRGGLTAQRMTLFVQQNGVAFRLTPAVERRLRALGADDAMIATITRVSLESDAGSHLIHQAMPVYPPMAKTARVQGSVVLRVTIDEAGNVTDVKVVSGHPMLLQAAINAVKQWKYTPFRLQGRPVPVSTTVTVTFHLVGG